MNLSVKGHKAITFLLLVITGFFFVFELGNLDGLRQGTEGFYLKITDEMFKANSLFEPLYDGKRHWSKPPFQFWLPQPFFYLFGYSNIFFSRLSIVLFTLTGIFCFSTWIKNHFKIEKVNSFLFFASSLAFFKYGRIFMMEMPLAILSSGSYLALYNYIDSKDRKSFWIGSTLLGFSVLVKGPVSIVMVIGSLSLFQIYTYQFNKKLILKEIAIISLASIVIASPWFLYSFYNHGMEFFNYFFLRENIGKFGAKSFPIRAVFQGLFLYSLPWSLYLPTILTTIVDDFKIKKNAYILLGFLFFFTLWIIPNQRSHHYAVPSIPLFLTYAIYKIDSIRINNASKIFHLIFIAILFIFVSIFTYITLALSLPGVTVTYSVITFITLLINFILVLKNGRYSYVATTHLVSVGLVWLLLIPSVALPKMPQTAINIVGKNKLTVVVTKPYFVSQALNKEVNLEKPSTIKNYIKSSDELYLLHKSLYNDLQLKDLTVIIHEWTIWHRGPKTREIFNALGNKDIKPLQDKLVLLRKI